MPTESQTEEPVQEVQAEAPVEEPTQDAPVEETEVPVAPTEGVQTEEIQGQLPLEEQPIIIEPPTPLPENAPDIQAKLDELSKMKRNNEEKAWEAQIIKQMQAVDRKAQQQGADPQTAREMAKQYGMSQKQLRDQQNESINLIQNIQGKEAAALHFLEKHKLADKSMLDNFRALMNYNSPQDMERAAMTAARLYSQQQEISRLKQGQVPPQTFDNSQGAAEPSSNTQKLLREFNSGARTQAHLDAVKSAMGRG